MNPLFWKHCAEDPRAALIELRKNTDSFQELCAWARDLAVRFKSCISLLPFFTRHVKLWKVIAATQLDEVVDSGYCGSTSLPPQGKWEVESHIRRAHMMLIGGKKILVEACLVRDDLFLKEFGEPAYNMVKFLLAKSNGRIRTMFEQQHLETLSNLEMMALYGDLFRQMQEENAAALQVRMRQTAS